MSETLRDAWNRDYSCRRESWARLTCDFLNEYGDLPIIHPAGPDAKPYIMTREAWEAARQPIAEALAATPGAFHDVDAFFVVADQRLTQALTALGPFVVADEVVEPVSYACIWTGPEKADHVWANPGDTIYIKRRESEERT